MRSALSSITRLVLVAGVLALSFPAFRAAAAPSADFGDDPHDYTPVLEFMDDFVNPDPGNFFGGGLQGYVVVPVQPGAVYRLSVEPFGTSLGSTAGYKVLPVDQVGDGCDAGNSSMIGEGAGAQPHGYFAPSQAQDPEASFIYVCIFYNVHWNDNLATITLFRVWENTQDGSSVELALDNTSYAGFGSVGDTPSGPFYYDIDLGTVPGTWDATITPIWLYHHGDIPANPDILDDPDDAAEYGVLPRLLAYNPATNQIGAAGTGSLTDVPPGDWHLIVDLPSAARPMIALLDLGEIVPVVPTPGGCVSLNAIGGEPDYHLDGELDTYLAGSYSFTISGASGTVHLEIFASSGDIEYDMVNGQTFYHIPGVGTTGLRFSDGQSFSVQVCPTAGTPTVSPTNTPLVTPEPGCTSLFEVAPNSTRIFIATAPYRLWSYPGGVPALSIVSINGVVVSNPPFLPVAVQPYSGGYYVAPATYGIRNPGSTAVWVITCDTPLLTATPTNSPTPSRTPTPTRTPTPGTPTATAPTPTSTPTAVPSLTPTTTPTRIPGTPLSGTPPAWTMPSPTPYIPATAGTPNPTYDLPGTGVPGICSFDPCFTAQYVSFRLQEWFATLQVQTPIACGEPLVLGADRDAGDWDFDWEPRLGITMCWFMTETAEMREWMRDASSFIFVLGFAGYCFHTIRRLGMG